MGQKCAKMDKKTLIFYIFTKCKNGRGLCLQWTSSRPSVRLFLTFFPAVGHLRLGLVGFHVQRRAFHLEQGDRGPRGRHLNEGAILEAVHHQVLDHVRVAGRQDLWDLLVQLCLRQVQLIVRSDELASFHPAFAVIVAADRLTRILSQFRSR